MTNSCFKDDRKNLWLFSFYFLLFSVMSGISWADNLGYCPAAEWTKHSLIVALFWTGWVVFAVYGLVSIWKSRLLLTKNGVQKTGCLRTKSVCWKDITKIRWRQFPVQGSVVLLARQCRMVIEFGSFEPADRLKIIEYIRAQSSHLVQEQWEVFSNRWLNPPSTPKTLPRWCAIVVSIFMLNFGVLSGVFWALNRQTQFLVFSIMNIVLAAWVFSSIWKSKQNGVSK